MGVWTIKSYLKNIPIHPSFILLFLWFVFTQNIYSFLLFCAVVLSHEFGHYFVAKKLGYKLDSFFIAPYGVCLNYKDRVFDSKDEIFIAIAGPLVNIILSLFAVSLWWICPESFNFTSEFVFESLMLGLFNLLPCYPLDGGRIFIGLISRSMPRKKAVNITIYLNIIFSAILFVLFIITCFYDFNPTLCLCSVFMILGIIDSKYESKYQPISIFKKKTKNFSKPFFYYVNGEVTLKEIIKKIEPNKFTIFVVKLDDGKTKMLDEEKIKLLVLSYPIYLSLKDIIN